MRGRKKSRRLWDLRPGNDVRPFLSRCVYCGRVDVRISGNLHCTDCKAQLHFFIAKCLRTGVDAIKIFGRRDRHFLLAPPPSWILAEAEKAESDILTVLHAQIIESVDRQVLGELSAAVDKEILGELLR